MLATLAACSSTTSSQRPPASPSADRSSGAAEGDGSLLSVLAYNVHGVSHVVAKDNPRSRMPTIGWLAAKYDVVVVQEDFEYHDILVQQMAGFHAHRGNGMWGHPVLVLTKVLVSPITAFIPRFSPPYGAGLTTFVRAELDVPEAMFEKPYHHCSGWLGDRLDCWARKGYLRVRVRTPEGAEVDVYNTHIEAGSRRRAVRAREANLERLAEAIETLSSGRAVVVAGDFNIAYARPDDRDLIRKFRARLGLEDSGAGPELAVWRERDFILFRSGRSASMMVEEAGEATEFVSRERALSDHPALFVNLRVRRAGIAP